MIKNVLFVVTVFFFIYPSFAQMTRNDSIILSDQLFAKGVEFYNSDRIYEAIPLFQKCDSIDEALNYNYKDLDMEFK